MEETPLLAKRMNMAFGTILSALPTKAKDIVFRSIIEYRSLRDFGP
jgi:hypothetical protein